MYQVKIFDEENEKDLNDNINVFLKEEKIERLFDIKFNISAFSFEEEQIYCFSAMIIYSIESPL